MKIRRKTHQIDWHPWRRASPSRRTTIAYVFADAHWPASKRHPELPEKFTYNLSWFQRRDGKSVSDERRKLSRGRTFTHRRRVFSTLAGHPRLRTDNPNSWASSLYRQLNYFEITEKSPKICIAHKEIFHLTFDILQYPLNAERPSRAPQLNQLPTKPRPLSKVCLVLINQSINRLTDCVGQQQLLGLLLHFSFDRPYPFFQNSPAIQTPLTATYFPF